MRKVVNRPPGGWSAIADTKKPPQRGTIPSPGQGDSVDRHGAAALGSMAPPSQAAPTGQEKTMVVFSCPVRAR
ncbi:MAG: hypothetical protein FWE95_03295 [Planctomycetaceae bacterium]|nr:hypothetical protein [Planctomycetaceae bacterium]